MKTRQEFKKDAYEAAKLLCANGFNDVILAFDYKIISEGNDALGAKFCDIPAHFIVSGVDSGELPLGD